MGDPPGGEEGEPSEIQLSALREAVFEGALDATLVADDRGLIVEANPACQELFGRSREELVGASVESLMPERFRRNHARERARWAQTRRPRPMGKGLLLYAVQAGGQEIPVDISIAPLSTGGRRLVAVAIRDLRGRSYSPDTIRVQATALHSAANGVVITDHEGMITWVNPAACAMTGYSAGELIGRHTRLFKSGEHADSFYASLWKKITSGEIWSGVIVNRRKDGRLYHEEQTIAPVVGPSGAVTHFVAIKQDVTRQHELRDALGRANTELAARLEEIQVLNERLRELAVRDPLTGLHNRRFFDEAIGGLLARQARTKESVCIAALDIDSFKAVNDELGHAAGDRALQALADVLRAGARASDLVCRAGGDEFLVCLPGITVASARERVESWRASFARRRLSVPGGATLHATVSIGLVQHRDGREEIEETIARADAALYLAKRSGRDRVMSPD